MSLLIAEMPVKRPESRFTGIGNHFNKSVKPQNTNPIAEHVGEMPYLSTCKRWERGDGSYRWMVTVVRLPSSAI